MNEDLFWRLIEEAKAEGGGDCDAFSESLTAKLQALAPQDILAFDGVMDQLLLRSYRWDLWGAAYLINGGASDDGFDYWRGWLMAQGRAVFENALRDPDSLADVIEGSELECEDILYVAGRAYEAKTGGAMPDRPNVFEAAGTSDPAGEHWTDDEDLERRLPRLAARVDALEDDEDDED